MKSEGVEYSEARYHRLELFEIIAQNGKLMNVGMDVREGFAVRVFYRGSMGFASSPGTSRLKELFHRQKRHLQSYLLATSFQAIGWAMHE